MYGGLVPEERHEGSASDAALVAAVAKARADFGVRCFWNAPILSDPIEDARLVVSGLRKYGGRRGWAAALGIDKALREALQIHATPL